MAEKNFSLKDQLFNADSLGDLAAEYAAGLPEFDGAAFREKALAGVPERTLVACIDWFADCLEPYLAPDFSTMADQLEAMMPPPLDPGLSDDDFGRFIHAVPGVLAVRHGMEDHRDRALDLLHAATKRFSMEFYIRPFLNRWPDETLERLQAWVRDENYHVRRLVSEGTRPKLPWAKAIDMGPDQTIGLLDGLHADPTRFVTRSVANHLNDIAKTQPDLVLGALRRWTDVGKQAGKELAWMNRHALRTLVKDGDPDAMIHLGYRADAPLDATLELAADTAKIGEALDFTVTLQSAEDLPVVVDYRLRFARPNGKTGEKVFKLKVADLKAGKPMTLRKSHKLKGNATTFTLHPGAHELTVQVNGVDRVNAKFELV